MIGLKAPVDYVDQLWSNKILMLLCEGPKPNISMISPKNRIAYMDTFFKSSISVNLKTLETQPFVNCRKDGYRTMMQIRSIQSRKYWIWDQ